jgi:hypothetical protein
MRPQTHCRAGAVPPVTFGPPDLTLLKPVNVTLPLEGATAATAHLYWVQSQNDFDDLGNNDLSACSLTA